jgi:hypothetical protein
MRRARARAPPSPTLGPWPQGDLVGSLGRDLSGWLEGAGRAAAGPPGGLAEWLQQQAGGLARGAGDAAGWAREHVRSDALVSAAASWLRLGLRRWG